MIQQIISHPVKVAVGVILIALFGVIAIARMPIQLTPEVQVPTVTVETRWPGASPEEVEREIVQEQEEQLQSVEGLRKMTSESSDSQGRVIMEFAVGTDMKEAMLRVNTRLSQVKEYPENADEPVIVSANVADRPIAWFVVNQRRPSDAEVDALAARFPQYKRRFERVRRAFSTSLAIHHLRKLAEEHPEVAPHLPEPVDVTQFRRFARDVIETQFERVTGVSNAEVMGGREEELQVVVDPRRLAARELTIAHVRTALRANVDTSGGDFWEGKRRYVVRTLGQARSVEQVAQTIVARRDGAPVYVRDVADVRLGFKKPEGMMRRYEMSTIGVRVMRETGSNVLDVMAGLRQAAAGLNDGPLKRRRLEITQVYDETEYIESAVGVVQDNLVEAGVLTLLALLVFLRSLRTSLVVFVAIGVSMVGMFLMMSLLGRSLNVPSLAGIAFAVGMLVDNFIVVLENIYRHYQSGERVVAATVRGTSEVWGAVFSSTLANLAVFIPVLFVEEEAGQLFRDIALATSSALLFSLPTCLILVPTAAARILRDRHGADLERPTRLGRLLAPLDAGGRGFVAAVTAVNAWVQRSAWRQILVAGSMFAASVGASWLLLPRVEYLPNGNRNLVFARIVPPPGYNLNQLAAMGDQVVEKARPYWDFDAGDPAVDQLPYPPIADLFCMARGRELFLGCRCADPMRASELVPLMREIAGGLPGSLAVATQSSLFEQGLSGGRRVDVEITGPEIRRLSELAIQMMGRLPAVLPGVQAIPRPSVDLANPEVHVVPKWEQAADMGVNAAELGYGVDALTDGAYAGDYFRDGNKIDITILASDGTRSRSQDLEALPIATPGGQLVPLAAVAEVRFGTGPEQILRRERQRAITLQVTPPLTIPLDEAIERIDAQIVQPLVDAGQLGGEYHVNFSGAADKLRSTWTSLRWNLLLAVVITYLLMAALFESFVYPLVIMLSVPLGAVGGIAALRLANLLTAAPLPLDVLTMLGFIILVGTVVNNPILIVEQALVLMRDEGLRAAAAVQESVRTRIRPIFMTAMIGLFGLVPLVISPGAGSELYRGIGCVLLGGLVASTVFTLFFVPSVFLLALRAGAVVGRLFHHHPAPHPAPPQVILEERAGGNGADTLHREAPYERTR